MLNDEWLTTQAADALADNSSLSEIVITRIKGLLTSRFSERPLTPAELKEISLALINEMVPHKPEEKAENEN